MLGSFIFGLPSDKPDTFKATADLASRAGLAFAQFVMLTPFPGTVDFLRWEKEQEKAPVYVDGIPVTRYWLIPARTRPKMFMPHPLMSSAGDQRRAPRVYGIASTVFPPSGNVPIAPRRCAPGLPSSSSPSFTARCMPAPASAPTVRAVRKRTPGRGGFPGTRASSSSQNQCRSLPCRFGYRRRPVHGATLVR